MFRGLLMLSILALAGVLSTVRAQDGDRCNDVLVRNLADRHIVMSDQNAALAIHQARCASSAGNSSNFSRTSGDVSYGFIRGNLKNGNESSQSNQTSDCGSGSADDHASAALYYSQTVFHDVVQAWQTCMTNARTFSCSVIKHGDARHLVVVAKWDIQSALPKVQSSRVQIGDRPPRDAYPLGTQLLAGDNQIYVDRDDDEAVLVNLVLTSDGYAGRQCSVMVPSVTSEIEVAKTAAATEAAAIRNADLDAEWTDGPVVAFSSQGFCSCVSSFRNYMDANAFPPPALPPGSTLDFVNNCGVPVSVWAVRDTLPESMRLFVGMPVQGRSFSFSHLAAGRKLTLGLSGAVGAFAQVRDCPATSTGPLTPDSSISSMPQTGIR